MAGLFIIFRFAYHFIYHMFASSFIETAMLLGKRQGMGFVAKIPMIQRWDLS